MTCTWKKCNEDFQTCLLTLMKSEWPKLHGVSEHSRVNDKIFMDTIFFKWMLLVTCLSVTSKFLWFKNHPWSLWWINTKLFKNLCSSWCPYQFPNALSVTVIWNLCVPTNKCGFEVALKLEWISKESIRGLCPCTDTAVWEWSLSIVTIWAEMNRLHREMTMSVTVVSHCLKTVVCLWQINSSPQVSKFHSHNYLHSRDDCVCNGVVSLQLFAFPWCSSTFLFSISSIHVLPLSGT